MTDDVLFRPGQRATRLRAATTGHCATEPDGADLSVLGSGAPAPGRGTARAHEVPGGTGEAAAGASLVAARMPSTTPVVRGTRPAPGCTVGGGRAFAATRREADTGVLRRSAAVVGDDPATAAERVGPVGGAFRTGLPAGFAGLGDVPTGRAVARATATRREADRAVVRRSAAVVGDDPATVAERVGPVGGALRTGLPTGFAGLGDVPTGRAVARAAPGDTVHQDAAAARAVVPPVEGERR